MRNTLFISTALLLFSIYGCKDTNDNNSVNNWYLFEETQCANPWPTGSGDTESAVITAVETHLSNLGVNFLATTIDSIPVEVSCLACECLTGRGIHVQATSSDESILLNEGFSLE